MHFQPKATGDITVLTGEPNASVGSALSLLIAHISSQCAPLPSSLSTDLRGVAHFNSFTHVVLLQFEGC